MREQAEPVAEPDGWWYRATVVGGIAAGVALRIWLLVLPTGTLDSDEAVVGLMARHIVHQHQFTTFYWGQNYGGSITAVVMAAVFAVFGSSTTTLKAVPIGMSAISALLVWRLGRRTIGEPERDDRRTRVLGVADELRVALDEGTRVLLGVHDLRARVLARGAAARRTTGPMAGLARARVARRARLVDEPADPLLRGARPDLARVPAAPRGVASRVAFPFAVIGALPWLVWNVHHHWAALVPTSHQFDKGYVGNIEVLFRHGLPVALGLNITERWLVPVVFPIVYVGILVLGTIALAVRRSKPWLLVLVVVTFPLLWGAFPVSGVVGDGRYVIFLLPAVALLLVFAARYPIVQVGFLVATLAVSVDGVQRIRHCTSSFVCSARAGARPQHTGPLIDALKAHHVTRFDGDYWIVYRVAFETNEGIVGSPRSFKRWPPYDRAVAADPDPPAVFVARSSLGPTYHRGLVRLGIAFERYRAGDFVVYQPARKVDLERVLDAGRPN